MTTEDLRIVRDRLEMGIPHVRQGLRGGECGEPEIQCRAAGEGETGSTHERSLSGLLFRPCWEDMHRGAAASVPDERVGSGFQGTEVHEGLREAPGILPGLGR